MVPPYFQAQMIAQQQQQNPQGIMPTQANPQNPMMQEINQMGQNMPQASSSPLLTGANAAMESIRQSMQVNQDERRRALGHALMRMGSYQHQKSHGPGFAGALGRFNEAFYPSYQAYQQEEQRMIAEKLRMLEMQRLLEREAQHEEFRRQQHEDLQRYRQQMLSTRVDKSGIKGKKGPIDTLNEYEGMDLSIYPEIESRQQRTSLEKEFKQTGRLNEFLDGIRKDVEEIKKSGKESLVAPTGSRIPYASKVKDYLAPTGAGKMLGISRKEWLARQRLKSKFARLEPQLEQGLKGSAPGEQMLKRFHNDKVYPSIDQTIDEIEDRLNDISGEIEGLHKASGISLKTGRIIDTPIKGTTGSERSGDKHSKSESNSMVSKIRQMLPAFEDYSDEDILEWSHTPEAQEILGEM